VRLLAAFGSGFGLPLQLGLGCEYRSFFLPLQGLSLSLSLFEERKKILRRKEEEWPIITMTRSKITSSRWY
jgi:hypothetical protein